MFDIGFWEMLFCGIVGLLVLGPEKLPSAIKQVASIVKKTRKTAADLTKSLSKELDAHELKQQAEDAQSAINKKLTDI